MGGMKLQALAVPFALAPLFCAGLAFAQGTSEVVEPAPEPTFEVAERDEDGRVTKVTYDGRIYDICIEDGQDSCINPRDAGLDFGTRELNYWPGRPASEIEEPLPFEKPPEPVETTPQEIASQDAEIADFDSAFTDLNEPAAR